MNLFAQNVAIKTSISDDIPLSTFVLAQCGMGNARGFSMVEVLVSLLILAVGVIGAAGMQLAALRANTQSSYHTVALQLASEIADRMRANYSQMRGEDGDNAYLSIDYDSNSGRPEPPEHLCYDGNCNAAQLAAFDIWEWMTRLHASLPGGRVRVCRDASPWDRDARALAWRCSATDTPGSLVIKVGWQEKEANGKLVRDGTASFPPAMVLTVTPYVR